MTTAPLTDGRPKLDLGTRLSYAIGSVAYGVKDQGLTALLMIFYNQVIGLPGVWVGLALGAALVLDAFVDPIIGQISDNTRGRWGRRHPFLYGSILPVVLGYLLLWNPPVSWSPPALCAWLVVWILIVRTFITIYEIPSSALISEFTPDYDKRTSLLSLRFLCGWLGGVGMTFLAFRVFLAVTPTNPAGLLGRAGYSTYALVAAAVMGLAILTSAAGTHRWIPYLPQAQTRERQSVLSTFREMTTALSHRSFLVIVVSGLFSATAMGVVSALSTYIGVYFWEFKAEQLGGLLLAGALAILTAVTTAPIISKVIGKKAGAMCAFAVSITIGPLPIVLRLLDVFPPNGAPVLLPLLMGFSYVSTTAYIVSTILGASMVADVVEDSQLRTGRRSEGLFFSASSLTQKAVGGLGILLSSVVLNLSGFPQKAIPGQVSEATLDRLGLIYVPLIVAFNLIALLVVSLYRIDRKTHRATLDQLAQLASEGSEAADAGIRLGG